MFRVDSLADKKRFRFFPQRVKNGSSAEAQVVCRRLARGHYENFIVTSWLLPSWLRPHFYSIYAYCRCADDLADEMGNREQRLAALDHWEAHLVACYEGRAQHPVFVALSETINQFDIPPEPFLDLLVAFRQDQHKWSYASIRELLEYCRYSACPVGRMILYLGRCHQREWVLLSDDICTGLQLANFWQDLRADTDRGRVYLPQDVCRHHGYDSGMLARREYNQAFRQLLAAEVFRAETLLLRGATLADRVAPELSLEVRLFVEGGLAILNAIRKVDYNVWAMRPTVTKVQKGKIFFRCWWGGYLRRHSRSKK